MNTKERRPSASTRRPTHRRRRTDADIVYTPPQRFDKFRFLLRIATVVAVVLAMTLGMAIFFKVQVINVSGMEKYTAWDIRQASGIEEGENLLSLNKARAGGKIRATLPYVDKVRIGIKLPDTVNIEITELTVVYAIADDANGWWLMNANGVVVEKIDAMLAQNYTQVLGVSITSPVVGQRATADEPEKPTEATEEPMENPGDETTATLPTVKEDIVTVFAAEQLSVAITMLQELEKAGVIGGVTSVDVTNTYDLQLWYEERYQVFFGDSSRLNYKLSAMKNAVKQMTDYQRGKLDVSFTQWPDKVGYTPFEE